MSNPRRNPSLPQNDPDPRARARQLADARETYKWTDDVPSLPGVPLSADVPSDDRPTLPWLLDVADVALDIVRNQIEIKLSHLFGEETSGTADGKAELGALQEAIHKGRAFHNPIRMLGDSVLGSPPDVEGYLESLKQLALRNALTAGDADDLSKYRALFASLPLPRMAHVFREDATFARMRVAGPNPMLLQGVTELPDGVDLNEHAIGAGDTVAAALAEGRLFMLDYQELTSIQTGTWNGRQKFLAAPIAMFAVPRGEDSLVPISIRCGQDPSLPPFFPSDHGPSGWAWQMAKSTVQVADGNYHELFVHLARTHLVSEAFAVATQRHLAERHPLNILLTPHFEGTLFINNLAATSLIEEGGPIDHIFAGKISSTQLAAAADRLAFDFYGKMPPNDLKSRNVDSATRLPNYPYRDDVMLVWKAIRDWAENYTRTYYHDHTDLAGDDELRAWVDALARDGRIAGFREITSIDQLIDVVAMVIFTASAQHAAVNFPQRPMMTFAPALSGALWADVPSDPASGTEDAWLRLLPPISLAQEQLNTLWLLGSVHYRPLGEYRTNDFPYRSWFKDKRITRGALPAFNDALRSVDREINHRNHDRAVPYPFLQPSLIPTSTNI